MEEMVENWLSRPKAEVKKRRKGGPGLWKTGKATLWKGGTSERGHLLGTALGGGIIFPK